MSKIKRLLSCLLALALCLGLLNAVSPGAKAGSGELHAIHGCTDDRGALKVATDYHDEAYNYAYEDEPVLLTFMPDQGFIFKSVSVGHKINGVVQYDDQIEVNYEAYPDTLNRSDAWFSMPDEDVWVYAEFEPEDPDGRAYYVSIDEAACEHGNISVQGGEGPYAQGEEITFIASPDEGYEFYRLYYKRIYTEQSGYQSPVTIGQSILHFTMPDRSVMVWAIFREASYKVKVSSASETMGAVSGGGTYNKGETVIVTASANDRYTFKNWTENDEVVSTDRVYSFTAEKSRDLVANFKFNGGIIQDQVVSDILYEMAEGCRYMVKNDVVVNKRVNIVGNVDLVLCDGATLTIPKGIRLNGENSLTIWGEEKNSGRLVIEGVLSNNAGIGGNSLESAGSLTVNGGSISVTGGVSGAGIGGGLRGSGGAVTVNGGSVNVNGGHRGAGIGGGFGGSGYTVTINGGTVTAYGGDDGAGIGSGWGGGSYSHTGGTVTVNGGTVNATGGAYAAGIGGGFGGRGGTVTINGGKVTAYGGYDASGVGGGAYCSCDNIIVNGGTVSAYGGTNGAAIGSGYKCQAAAGTIIINGGNVTASGGSDAASIGGGSESYGADVIIAGGSVSLIRGDSFSPIGQGKEAGDDAQGGLTLGSNTKGKYMRVGVVSGETVDWVPAETRIVKLREVNAPDLVIQECTDHDFVNGACRYCGAVLYKYVNGNGMEFGEHVAASVSEETTVLENGMWYAVTGDVTVSQRITVAEQAEVNIILCDNASLEALEGISVPEGSSLIIWAQSDGENMGSLTATGADGSAGIGGSTGSKNCGSVTVCGGNITASGGSDAAGIGGGSSSGVFEASGTYEAISITGGIVTAVGGSGAEAIGRGAGITPAAGELELDGMMVSVMRNGVLTPVTADKRASACSSKGAAVVVQPCTHSFENGYCSYCGAAEAQKYTVTYYANNGTGAAIQSSAYAGSAVLLAENPFTWAGRTFEGWCTSRDCSGTPLSESFPVTLSRDLFLWAKWSSIPAAAPVITVQPQDLELAYGYTSASLSVEASAPEGCRLIYQWFSAEEKTNTWGSEVWGAGNSSLELPTGKSVGTELYYYCAVIAQRNDNGMRATVYSDAVSVTVVKAQNRAVINGSAGVPLGGNTVKLSDNVKTPDGDVSYAIKGDANGCTVDEKTGLFTSGQAPCTCTVTVTAAGDGNYLAASADITVNVTGKNTAALTVSQPGATYGETLPAPSYDGPAGGTQTLSYSGTLPGGGSYGPSPDAPSDAGRYTVSVTYETSDTVYSGSADFEIAPLEGVAVTVKGKNNTADYDGKEHKVEGYEVSISSKLYKETDFTFSGKAEAVRTDAGTAKMGLTSKMFENKNPNFKDVAFTVTDGYQTVNAISVKVTITGHQSTVNYDGREHKVEGYDFKPSNALYKKADFSFSGKAEAVRTDAGTTKMGLSSKMFDNKNPNFKDVAFTVTDGYQTVNAIDAELTISAEESSDGSKVTVTVTQYTYSNVKALALAAWYDSSGRLLGCAMDDAGLTGEAGSAAVCSLSRPAAAADAALCRVMLLEKDTYAPLQDAVTV